MPFHQPGALSTCVLYFLAAVFYCPRHQSLSMSYHSETNAFCRINCAAALSSSTELSCTAESAVLGLGRGNTAMVNNRTQSTGNKRCPVLIERYNSNWQAQKPHAQILYTHLTVTSSTCCFVQLHAPVLPLLRLPCKFYQILSSQSRTRPEIQSTRTP